MVPPSQWHWIVILGVNSTLTWSLASQVENAVGSSGLTIQNGTSWQPKNCGRHNQIQILASRVCLLQQEGKTHYLFLQAVGHQTKTHRVPVAWNKLWLNPRFHLYLIWNETNKSGETAFYAGPTTSVLEIPNNNAAILCRIPQPTTYWHRTHRNKNKDMPQHKHDV